MWNITFISWKLLKTIQTINNNELMRICINFENHYGKGDKSFIRGNLVALLVNELPPAVTMLRCLVLVTLLVNVYLCCNHTTMYKDCVALFNYFKLILFTSQIC